jgi:hypothetical protein
MTAPRDCSHFIGLHTAELIELLCDDRTLPEADREQLRRFAALLRQVYHQHYHRRLVDLKNAYAPFDPDSDSQSILPLSAIQKQKRLNDLLSDFAWLLDRAHFRHLDRREMEQTLGHSSDFGIHMDVDFSAFEYAALFVRGETYQKRILRSWRSFYSPREVEVPIFRRLVLILKLRQHPRLGPGVDTEHVLLKVFKDIPRADVDMLLPGARVKLRVLDRGKVGVGLLSGIGTLFYRMASELGKLLEGIMLNEAALWGLTAGLLGYGYKSYYDYQQTRQSYHLNLTQSLYFQNLDSNAGVLTRLFDEAEEQEIRTTLLAYYCLWRYGGADGSSDEELESAMELLLDRYAELTLLCEPGEPARKLASLEMIQSGAGRHRALPLDQALGRLQGLRDCHVELPPRPGAKSNHRV